MNAWKTDGTITTPNTYTLGDRDDSGNSEFQDHRQYGVYNNNANGTQIPVTIELKGAGINKSTSVAKNDVANNINYTDEFYYAPGAGQIDNILSTIVDQITTPPYQPITEFCRFR